jgi:hypothetical protein
MYVCKYYLIANLHRYEVHYLPRATQHSTTAMLFSSFVSSVLSTVIFGAILVQAQTVRLVVILS